MSLARETSCTFFIMYLSPLISVYGLVNLFYTPPQDSGGVLWFHVGHLSVCPSVCCPSVRFSFPDDNLSKHQWIFIKLGMCIDIGIANGQISSNFDSYLPETRPYFFVSGR